MKTTKKTISIAEAMKAGNDGQNQDIKGQFIGREVFCNVGSMVEFILSASQDGESAPFSIDDVENLYTYPEYIGKFAAFDGGTEDERNTEIERLQEMASDLTETEPEKAEKIVEEIEALENLETEPQEIFEWWAVSSFLFDKLRAMGHPVIDTGSVHVWGRCTTGQAIILDYAITKICAEMEILEGQANSWAKK